MRLVARPALAVPAGPRATIATVNGPLAGKRLLVVDEDTVLAGLLVEAVIRLGGAALPFASGQAALEALGDAGPFHAAVVDLPLPDLRAAEVLGGLRRAGVPAVAVSGAYRGPQAAGEALRAGAADFFEKPFSALTLMSRLARLMGTALPGLPEPVDEVTSSEPLPMAIGPGGQAIDDAPFLDLADEEASGEPPPPLPFLAAPLPAGLAGTSGPPGAADARPPPRGELGQVTVPRLLVALHLAQATGALTIRRGPIRKILLVDRGVPTYAASNLAGERMGAICLRRGLVTPEALDGLRRAEPAVRTADLLLRAGAIDEVRLEQLTFAQVRAIAWSTFEWREGQYELALGRPPAGLRRLHLPMADLLLEGLVRVSTPAMLAAELPLGVHLAPATDPAFELYALGLRPAEAHLLSLCDGTKSVGDLLSLARLPEREAMAFLQACRVMRVVDEVERVLAGTRRIGFM